jgi:hypothetical protein
MLLFFSNSAIAQINCTSPWPSSSEYLQIMQSRQAIWANSGENKSSALVTIPVAIHMTRQSDGTPPFTSSMYTSAYADEVVAYLNQIYTGSNLSFVRLGEINHMDFSPFINVAPALFWPLEAYSYVPSALNIYVNTSGTGYGPQPTQPTANGMGFTLNNNKIIVDGTLWYTSIDDFLYSTVAHEVGHTLTLLHTFARQYPFIYPPTIGQVDHPYNPTNINDRRELDITTYDASKAFPTPNNKESGDLISDTKADCGNNSGFNYAFPVWQNGNPMNCLTSQCLLGCSGGCSGGSTYRDYNGDFSGGNPKNVMAYYGCDSELTAEQKQAAHQGYLDFWSTTYDASQLYAINDKVEFINHPTTGQGTGLGGVAIQLKDPNGGNKFCRSFSNTSGNFQGVPYTNLIRPALKKLGSGSTTNAYIPASLGPYYLDAYTNADWLQGLKTCDITAIQNHILGIAPLNGWQQLAGDANKSFTLTASDIVEFRKLLLGAYQKLPNYDAPWRFIPEYVPELHLSAFNYNPNVMPVLGVTQANYTEPTWTYAYNTGSVGNRGFDAVHLGDVSPCTMLLIAQSGLKGGTKSKSDEFASAQEHSLKETNELIPGNTYVLDITADQMVDFASFQAQFYVNMDALTDIEVESPAVKVFHTREEPGFHQFDDKLRLLYVKSGHDNSQCQEGEVLFRVKFTAKAYVADYHEAIRWHNDEFESLIESSNLEGFSVSQNLTSAVAERGAEVPNNSARVYPNPLKDVLNVVFESATNDVAEVSVFDLANKLIHQEQIQAQTGWNHVILQRNFTESMPASSVLYIQLRTIDGKYTTKVITK